MAGELLASLEDINLFLPEDKLQMTDAEDDQYQVEVNRMVKAFLSQTFQPTTLAGWDEPTNTPDYVRSIAGRLIAALYYANRTSEEEPDGSAYAQSLYDVAMDMLRSVRNGTVVLLDVTEDSESTVGSLTSDDFYPTSAVAPAFTMDLDFG
jgi:hypothetical protein